VWPVELLRFIRELKEIVTKENKRHGERTVYYIYDARVVVGWWGEVIYRWGGDERGEREQDTDFPISFFFLQTIQRVCVGCTAATSERGWRLGNTIKYQIKREKDRR
jgi:hypothetical protein